MLLLHRSLRDRSSECWRQCRCIKTTIWHDARDHEFLANSRERMNNLYELNCSGADDMSISKHVDHILFKINEIAIWDFNFRARADILFSARMILRKMLAWSRWYEVIDDMKFAEDESKIFILNLSIRDPGGRPPVSCWARFLRDFVRSLSICWQNVARFRLNPHNCLQVIRFSKLFLSTTVSGWNFKCLHQKKVMSSFAWFF